MTGSLGQFVRYFLYLVALSIVAACSTSQPSGAAPYAAHVMDARTGETLYSENADTKLHPASLTKMMTLYIAFQEIENGNLSLDTMITVSSNAAAQPPSRLGLKSGQKIALRYLIRAAAVKSANDAAAAIGDAISGSPAKFGERMTRTAKSLGMKNTTFRNANGLTAKGHLSTAHDMSIMGRRVFYDFPQYYNIFSRRTTDAGMATVANTNRRFLDAYDGADGIKTGYTDAAGFNLTASAERGGVRIIATVFGGSSTADRNAKVSDLLNLGFRKADPSARTVKPEAPVLAADGEAIAGVDEALPEVEGGAGKTVRVAMAVSSSPRPQARPVADPAAAVAAEVAVASMQADIAGALAEATAEAIDGAAATPQAQVVDIALDIALDPVLDDGGTVLALAEGATPEAGTVVELSGTVSAAAVEPQVAVAETLAAPEALQELTITAAPSAEPMQLAAVIRPAKRNLPIYEDAAPPEIADLAPETEVVIRVSTSGGSHFGVNVGHFTTRDRAERALLKIQLNESETLGSGLRKVNEQSGGYDANILGLTQDEADLACRRLQQRGTTCFTLAP